LRERFLDPARGRRRLLPHLIGQRHRVQHLLPFVGGTEEQVEGLRKNQRVLAALDEDRLKRREHIGAVADIDELNRIHRVDRSARPDRNACGAQRTGKADNVISRPAGWR